MTTHARLSPSAAHRWVPCTASVAFIEELRAKGIIKPEESSSYADEGTEAHALAAAILTGSPLPVARDQEMQTNVNAYVEWVRSWHHKTTKQTLWVERPVAPFYAPEGKPGTADAVVWGKSFIFIGDLKYGVGVSVEAEKNKQLAIYAESVIREIEEVFEVRQDMPIHLGIFQPRDRNNPEPVRLWNLTRAELADFCAFIEHSANTILATPLADDSREGPAPTDEERRNQIRFVADPDHQCRFCPAKGVCKTYANYGLVTIIDDDVDKVPVELPSPNLLTREQRQKVIKAAPALKAFLAAVEEKEMEDLLGGAQPMDFKLVAGKSNRQWVDETAAGKLLGNYLKSQQLYPPSKLVSPAQAEGLLKGIVTSTRFNNSFAKLITKPEGKPTLVGIEDKRPALQINPTEGLTKVETLDDV